MKKLLNNYFKIFILGIFLVLQSCVSPLGGDSELSFENDPDLRDQVMSILNNRCASCHDGSSSILLVYPTDEEYMSLGLINPGNAETSPLYGRLKGSTGGIQPKDMPAGGFQQIPPDELNSIKTWINQMSSSITEIKINSPIDGAVVPQGVTIAGICQSGLTIEIAGPVVSPTQLNCNSGSFSANFTLSTPDEEKMLTFTQIINGAEFSDQISVVLDTTPPDIQITSPPAGTIDPIGVDLVGSCETDLMVVISGDIESPLDVPCNNGLFGQAIVFSQGDGNKEITVEQTDGVGLNNFDSRSFVKDTTINIPEVEITSPTTGEMFNADPIPVTGICDEAYPVIISGDIVMGMTINCNPGGIFNTQVVLNDPDGPKVIRAEQTDPGPAGGTGSSEVTVLKDTTAPILTIEFPSNGKSFIYGTSIWGTCELNGVGNIILTGDLPAPMATDCVDNKFRAEAIFNNGYTPKQITLTHFDELLNYSQSIITATSLDPALPANRNQAVNQIIDYDFQCLSCHNSGQDNFVPLETDEQWANSEYVMPQNYLESSLYNRLIGSEGSMGVNDMPSGGLPHLGNIELNVIKNWILQIEEAQTGGGGDSQYQRPRIMDREFVSSVMQKVFGTSLETISILEDTISYNVAGLHGPCDYYGQIKLDHQGFENETFFNPAQVCYGAGNSGLSAAFFANSTPYRAAWFVNACSRIVDKRAIMVAALSKIGATGPLVDPNPELITKAYKLFYQQREPSTEVVNALLATANENLPEQDADGLTPWRRVYLSMCMAADWTIP